MAIELIDLVSGFKAGVDALQQIKVGLAALVGNSGFVALAAESDPGGSLVGGSPIARYMKQLDADDDFRLRVSLDSLDFQEPWSGAALNSAQWSSTVTTFTTTVAGEYLKSNNGASAAANGVARVQSYRSFAVESSFPLYIEFPMQIVTAALPITNATAEWGWGISSGTTAPTDGVFLTYNAAGEWRLIAYYNGVPNQSGVIDASVFSANVDAEIGIVINTVEAELWVNNVLRATVDRPAALPALTQSNVLPITFRVYNGAIAPSTAVQMYVGPVTVSRGGMANGKTASEMSVMSGWGGYQGQSGGTMGYTANSANSAAPASATLANATAGYATNGGQFQFAAVAGAETDYALFAYQIPAIAVGAYNRGAVVRGVRIDTYNTVVAVATTPTLLQWQIGVGATAITLATVADTATAKQSRRIPLGSQSFVVGDLVGKQAVPLDVKFAAPLFVEPGTYIHIILKMPLGTATATEIFRGTVFIDWQYLD